MVFSVLDACYFWGIRKSLSYSSTEMLFLRFAAGFSKDVKKQGREGRKKNNARKTIFDAHLRNQEKAEGLFSS